MEGPLLSLLFNTVWEFLLNAIKKSKTKGIPIGKEKKNYLSCRYNHVSRKSKGYTMRTNKLHNDAECYHYT